jgi:GT2 family glycosyltransferase
MNPTLLLTRNNLNLTKLCVESLRKQDIPTNIYIVDNGSKDGTWQWAEEEHILLDASPLNNGFSEGMNHGLAKIFGELGAEHCLCVGSDTILPTYFYRTLLSLNLPVVSGVQDINGHRVTLEDLSMEPPIQPLRPAPDFSALLFKREAWEAVGPLDCNMRNYASDCDFHVRAHLMGVRMYHAHVPFFHEGSATIRFAPDEERRDISRRADLDRLEFQRKHGVSCQSKEYGLLFREELFGANKEKMLPLPQTSEAALAAPFSALLK